ncbi:MAG: NADH-quinone oxidoreductase subunit L [Microbacter sp.]
MNSYDLSSLFIVGLPLLSFAFIILLSKRLKPGVAGLIGTLAIATTAVLAFYVAAGYFFGFGAQAGSYVRHIAMQFQWLKFTENLSIDMGIVLDPISIALLIVITVVSTMVHLYSLNYMHGEDYFARYYGYLSLFTFSMLGLVLSVNIFQMYIFWELVGLSSYLLIGFYFTRSSAIAAAKKAFIVTRFADLGFLIGILILSHGAKTLDFFVMIQRLTEAGSPYLTHFTATTFMGLSTLTWALLLVFMGGAGKSAMFPLHIWLPDAMEGPTPVSALIHAATMVVAGVYLVARLFPIYAISAPEALHFIAYIGAFTALFAAIIACTQTDIKRVLAYSTISQIAYMMFALGVAGWGEGQTEGFTASIFHLFTHAFFKALLFLGAGAIIHAISSNEMDNMGGLRKALPITHITFLVACLSIAGIPPFSGFFSKEAILSAASLGNPLVYYIGLFTSGLTAFYMFRLYFRIFWYKPISDHHNHEKQTWAMNSALLVLMLGAAFAGFIPFGSFVSATGAPIALPFHPVFSILPVSLGLLGIFLAYLFFYKESDKAEKTVAYFKGFYQAAYHKFYIDEIYMFVTKKIIFNLVGRPAAWFDRTVVNGIFINGTATVTEVTSETIKPMQSGKVQDYAMYFLGGTLLLVALLLIQFM